MSENNEELFELQHRVKNSFSLITSLIGIKKSANSDEKVGEVLDDLQIRILAISDLYTLLHKEKQLKTAPVDRYIMHLLESCEDFFPEIYFHTDCDPFELPVKDASALGQIIIELIINAVKYAFDVEQYEKFITISLKTENKRTTLLVCDNGKGFEDSFNPENAKTTGYILCHALSSQIGAKLKTYNDNGAVVALTWDTVS